MLLYIYLLIYANIIEHILLNIYIYMIIALDSRVLQLGPVHLPQAWPLNPWDFHGPPIIGPTYTIPIALP